MAESAQPALKDVFSAARFRRIAALLTEIDSEFDPKIFLKLATTGLEPLSLLQRMRHGSHALRATLPSEFPAALAVLQKLAPRLERDFTAMMLPDFVGVYGADHFDLSLEGLRFMTRFSSSEFAIREFLRRDLHRTLAVMERWSLDPDEHVRRLASEGSRPRLPWSFRLEKLVADPTPAAGILQNLRADPSLYVRKSVANHLNDVSKNHPEWMLARLGSWDLAHPHTQWIAKRAARTLIKAGHQPTLRFFNFTGKPSVKLNVFRLAPTRLKLGQALEFSFTLTSTARNPQQLAVDYVMHYVKASGLTAPKVFKLREVSLASGESLRLTKRQTLRNFTTRKHHPGRHHLEIQVNGLILGRQSFLLRV